jgi:hypothetical protein
LARSNEELAKGNTELAKGYQELLNYCMLVEQSYKEAQATLRAQQAEQDSLRGLGPISLGMARWLSGLSHRLPGPVSLVKKLMHLDQPETLPVKKVG